MKPDRATHPVEKEVFGVFLMEDHASFRQTMCMLLDGEPEFRVVGQAGTLKEARDFLGSLGEKDSETPTVGLFDLDLPDGNGTEVIAGFQDANPEFAALVLTASLEDVEHARAVEAGASGVLHKASDIDEILGSLKTLASGESLLSAGEIRRMVKLASAARTEKQRPAKTAFPLTKREAEVLTALAQGKSNKEIAAELSISVDTERTHMVNILHKLGAHSRLQALVTAVRLGIVDIDRVG